MCREPAEPATAAAPAPDGPPFYDPTVRVFYTDTFRLPLPAGHRFPMSKYTRLRERLGRAGWIPAERLRVPHAATDREILLSHDAGYLERVVRGTLDRQEVRRIGFPWTPGMVERSRRSSGATIEAAAAALEDGVAVSLAGGTHHAFRDRGEGFCVFNDSTIAARALRERGAVRRTLVIDCDVHQGNGTAAIARGDDAIFAFSIHGANNFPYRKEPGDLDVPLPDGTGDADYLAALEPALDRALEAARPDLAIYLAGADPWEGDRWGRLALTKAGLAERDRMVLERCRARGLPVAVTMAGGYAPDVEDTVDVHFATVAIAARVAGVAGAGGDVADAGVSGDAGPPRPARSRG